MSMRTTLYLLSMLTVLGCSSNAPQSSQDPTKPYDDDPASSGDGSSSIKNGSGNMPNNGGVATLAASLCEQQEIMCPPGPAGEMGAKGDKGDTGDQGPMGLQGAQGLPGDQGPAGPQGLKGDTGGTGPQGVQGPQGSQGIQGIQGVKGDSGKDGAFAVGSVYTASSSKAGPVGQTNVEVDLIVRCDPGDMAITGGCSSVSNNVVMVAEGLVLADTNPEGWHCHWRFSQGGLTGDGIVRCLNVQ
jgi:hypothetical protein